MNDHYRGYEFMDLDPDSKAEPDRFEDPVTSASSAVASGQGAGTLGFAGTSRNDTATRAAGLITLADDDFGGGPRMPMVPCTWEHDQPGGSADGADGGK
jgi:PPE-repeat protein